MVAVNAAKSGDRVMKKRRFYRKKSRWENAMALMWIAAVVVVLALGVKIRSSAIEKKDLEYQRREQYLTRQVQEEKERAEELEEYRIYVQTKKYIEEVAKQKLGLVKPDEILLKPVPKN